MGNERRRLGARLAASAPESVCGAGEGGAGAINFSAEIGWEPRISRDARGRVSASVPGQDSELFQLAVVGRHRGFIDYGGTGAYVYSGRLEIDLACDRGADGKTVRPRVSERIKRSGELKLQWWQVANLWPIVNRPRGGQSERRGYQPWRRMPSHIGERTSFCHSSASPCSVGRSILEAQSQRELNQPGIHGRTADLPERG